MGYNDEDADQSLLQYRCTNVLMRLAPSFFVKLGSDSNDVSNILIPSAFVPVCHKCLLIRFSHPLTKHKKISPHRLVLSRFEIEGAPLGENSVESEEDEEEVWLFWKDCNKEIRSKSIRELAQDAKEGQKEDQEVVSYYR